METKKYKWVMDNKYRDKMVDKIKLFSDYCLPKNMSGD